jgi:hypothetical protein
LIIGATTIPTPDEFWVASVMNQFIAPTHPDQTIEPVVVTTPEEMGPSRGSTASSLARSGLRKSGGLVAQRGRMSRGGNSRGSSTSRGISPSGPGSPTWSRRWPTTATTIW